MRYACLIYSDPAEDPANDPSGDSPEVQEVMRQYIAFGEKWASKITGGEALLPISSATTVRRRDGEVMTTDGPFAESKEHLGGFYLIDAEDLDEAIQIASEIPGANTGSIEIRPVAVFD
jgi:hypothetical protein